MEFDLTGIIAIVSTVAATIFGKFWRRMKRALTEIIKAAADDNITPEEVQNIALAWNGKLNIKKK